MRVSNTTFNGVIEGQKQFRIPIWQRQYTWRAGEHEQLWRDLLEQYDALANAAERSTHFLGSFVLAPLDPMASHVLPRDRRAAAAYDSDARAVCPSRSRFRRQPGCD
jgi:hypothetical protein